MTVYSKDKGGCLGGARLESLRGVVSVVPQNLERGVALA